MKFHPPKHGSLYLSRPIYVSLIDVWKHKSYIKTTFSQSAALNVVPFTNLPTSGEYKSLCLTLKDRHPQTPTHDSTRQTFSSYLHLAVAVNRKIFETQTQVGVGVEGMDDDMWWWMILEYDYYQCDVSCTTHTTGTPPLT